MRQTQKVIDRLHEMISGERIARLSIRNLGRFESIWCWQRKNSERNSISFLRFKEWNLCGRAYDQAAGGVFVAVECFRRIPNTSFGFRTTSAAHAPNPPCSFTAFIHSPRNCLLLRFSCVSCPLTSRTRFTPFARRIRKSGRYFFTKPCQM